MRWGPRAEIDYSAVTDSVGSNASFCSGENRAVAGEFGRVCCSL